MCRVGRKTLLNPIQSYSMLVLALEVVTVLSIICLFFFDGSLLITLMGHIKLTDFGLSKMGLMNCTFCHNFYICDAVYCGCRIESMSPVLAFVTMALV